MDSGKKEEIVKKFNARQRILGSDYILEYDDESDTIDLISCGLETAIIPDYVDGIDPKAFNNSRTVKVVGGSGLRNVRASAFYNCNYIKIADFSRCTKLNSLCKTFKSCPNMAELRLPDSLEVMDHIFLSCEGANITMRIPNSVRAIRRGGLVGTVENEEISTDKIDLSGTFKGATFKKVIINRSKSNIPIKFENCGINELVVENMIHFSVECYDCTIKKVIIKGEKCPVFNMCTIDIFRAYNIRVVKNNAFFMSTVKDLDIGNQLENIGNFAFANSVIKVRDEYNLLDQLHLTSIGDCAFNCCKLTNAEDQIIDIHIKVEN